MGAATHHPPLTPQHLLLAPHTHSSLLTPHSSLPTTHYPLPTTQHPLPTTHYPLLNTHYPTPTTHYPTPTTHYSACTFQEREADGFGIPHGVGPLGRRMSGVAPTGASLSVEMSPSEYAVQHYLVVVKERCSLLTAHYLLLTAHCTILTTRYSLLTAHYSLLAPHSSLLTTLTALSLLTEN